MDKGHVHISDEEHTASDGSEDSAVETLLAGRQRRSNAGSRLARILGTEEDEAYAEDERQHESLDADFAEQDRAAADDVDLGSSSDEEDRVGEVDELEGEKELEKHEKLARRALKRKAQGILMKPPAFHKRVKIDPLAGPRQPTVPVSRQRKKSERVSWLPAPDEGPTRTSSRRLTVQNKEFVHARMKETEARRLRQIATMEAAAKRKERTKPKVMTQADRLAEAERTERKNSKSLNRWEETEKRKVEEQKARLEALQNRRITGPMIRWYSGPAEWIDGKLKHVGKRPKIAIMDAITGQTSSLDGTTITVGLANGDSASTVMERSSFALEGSSTVLIAQEQGQNSVSSEQTHSATVHEQHPASCAFLDGIHFWASKTPEAQPQIHSLHTLPPITSDRQAGIELNSDLPPLREVVQGRPPHTTVKTFERSTRNMLILENIDSVAAKDKDLPRQILFNWRKSKFAKPVPPTCVITMAPARYRDPKTGLAYSNAYAYKGIQRLLSGTCQWSNLLGCYVGPVYENPVGRPAIGVPENFWAKKTVPLLQDVKM